MKRIHRMLSVLMIACLMISGATLSAFASSTNYVKFPVTMNYQNAQQVLKLINKERTKRGLKKLKLDKGLCNSADIRAAELAIFIPEMGTHYRPNGKQAKKINKKIIYECCAEGYETPKAVVKGWMSSPPHKKGILLSNARSVGIGCIETKNGTHMWTLEFSAQKPAKVMKSKAKVKKTYKITALTKYLKKKNFRLAFRDDEYELSYDFDMIDVGDSAVLGAYYINNYDFETLLRASDFIWKSSNKSVATVDSKGKVTGVGEGTAIITATMKKGLKYKLKFELDVDEGYSDDW